MDVEEVFAAEVVRCEFAEVDLRSSGMLAESQSVLYEAHFVEAGDHGINKKHRIS